MFEEIKKILGDFEHTLHERIDDKVLEVQTKDPNRQIIDTTDIWRETFDEYARQLAALQPQVDGELELTFTKEQILGLIPAQAILDYDRAKEVLESVSQATARKCKPIIEARVKNLLWKNGQWAAVRIIEGELTTQNLR